MSIVQLPTQITSFEHYQSEYAKSVDNPEAFWAEQAKTFSWRKEWDKVLEWDFTGPNVKWFQGGQLNITENCLDRHLAERGDQTALLFEPNEPGDPSRAISYRELHTEVCKTGNALRSLGIGKGDRVCFYMPMV
ncbi:MAG: acetyl-coenzyme A synthetase N-terminal domain-containing protein, partial [Bacteroidota bacterium]